MAPIDISQALGDFMLKGYVLTNQTCPTPGCAIPILSTPRGKIPVVTFCVECSDGGPSTSTSRDAASKTPVSSQSSASRLSRSSTPPTEVSEVSTHSDFELPPETDDMRRRREQSDRASSELGKRLLQGWTMLGDECPNEGCYGVPLVCPPRATGAADPVKECVICATIYKTEVDWAGREALVSIDNTAPVLSPAPPTNRQGTSSPLRTHSLDSNLDIPVINQIQSTERKPQLSATGDTLNEVSEALQKSLQALSSQLLKLSSSVNLDSKSIGMTADAIGKVTQTLSQVRQLSNSISNYNNSYN